MWPLSSGDSTLHVLPGALHQRDWLLRLPWAWLPACRHLPAAEGAPPEHKVLHACDLQLVGNVGGRQGGHVYVEELQLRLVLGLRLAQGAADILVQVLPLEPAAKRSGSQLALGQLGIVLASRAGATFTPPTALRLLAEGKQAPPPATETRLASLKQPQGGTRLRGQGRGAGRTRPSPPPCAIRRGRGERTHSPRRMSGTWKDTTASFCRTTKSTGASFCADGTLTDTRTPSGCKASGPGRTLSQADPRGKEAAPSSAGEGEAGIPPGRGRA